MLHSMTGFAALSTAEASLSLRLELKSVNHRYLDIQCRLPEELRYLEHAIRTAVTAVITRGKVECRIALEHNTQYDKALNVNWQAVDALAHTDAAIRHRHPGVTALSAADILRYPGVVVAHAEADEEHMKNIVTALLQQALARFKQDRAREGLQLQAHLLTRLDTMTGLIDRLQSRFPQLVAAHIQKIEQRLRDAVDSLDDERLKQEFALFMQKIDVDEEFSRLRTHIAEVRRIVTGNTEKSAGKRLDFLMQELNREANTLGSKAFSVECTQTSVELKVLIEQMREQVQNIE